MRTEKLFLIISMGILILASCNQSETIQLPQPSETPKITLTPENTPTITPTPSVFTKLPQTISSDGNRLTFTQWGFSMEISSEVWLYNPVYHSRKADFESFTFTRIEKLVDKNGEGCAPSISIHFFKLPENMNADQFSSFQLVRNSSFFLPEKLFGHEGSKLELPIPAVGYYGHLNENENYSVFVIYTGSENIGIQISFEVLDTALDQAEPEFYEIMKTFKFEPINTATLETAQNTMIEEESFESKLSAIFISDMMIEGQNQDLSKGSDGFGKGVDPYGRLFTCEDLALHLTTFHSTKVIEFSDPSEIIPKWLARGDIVIFTNSHIPGITAHAAVLTDLDENDVYFTGQYGPKPDGTYYSDYKNLSVSEFFPTIYDTMTIYRYVPW